MKLVHREDFLAFSVLSMAFVARRFPGVRQRFADGLALMAYAFSRQKRAAMERALDAAFGARLTASQKKAVVLGSLRSVWEELFGLVAGAGARSEFDNCEIRGIEHLRASQSRGRGTILWESTGFGTRWMPKRLLEELGFRLLQVHASNHAGGFPSGDKEGSRLRGALLRPLVDRLEGYFLSELFFLRHDGSLSNLRELERRLRQNGLISVAADGVHGQRHLPLAVAGGTLRFPTGMVNLARLTGADLLPLFGVRRAEGGFALMIEAPIQMEDAGGRGAQVEGALAQYCQSLESYILRYPEQYRNWHILV